MRRLVPGIAVFTGSGATEEHVNNLRSPALLHIVGHGVVRGNQDCPPSPGLRRAGPAEPCLAAAIDASTQEMSLAAIVLEEAYGRLRSIFTSERSRRTRMEPVLAPILASFRE